MQSLSGTDLNGSNQTNDSTAEVVESTPLIHELISNEFVGFEKAKKEMIKRAMVSGY